MTGAGQMDLLIDEAGHLWPNGSIALRARVGYPGFDDLAGHVVRDRGFAWVRRRGATVRIMVRAGLLEPRTLETVVRFLLTEPWRRLVIEQPNRTPPYEIFGEVEDAVARLKDLGAATSPLGARDRFSTQELSLARLAEGGNEPMRALFRLWRSRRGHLPPDQIIGLMPPALKTRMTLTRIVRPAPGLPGRALIEHIGTGFHIFDPCWTLCAIGRDLEEQPDPIYGASSARSYHEVAAVERPRLELVDAVIEVPGRSARRSRYERLILPWQACGELFVCGASILRTSYLLEPAAGVDSRA
jgi:hypothetical protein